MHMAAPFHVLCVEDSPEDLADARQMLLRGSARRYQFTEATTAAAALQALRDMTTPPDCILLDFTLPDMDAIELLAELRAGGLLPICPVVVLTGMAESGPRAIVAGAQEFIGKSWASPESLTRALESAVERFAMTRERQRAEAALCASEQALRLFVQNAPVAVAQFDQEMRYLAASGRWQQEYALTGDLTGRSHFDMFPDLAGAWKLIHRRVLAGETVSSDGDLLERADGRVRWVKWEALPWRDATGGIGGIFMSAEDITVHKQAEEVRREEAHFLQKVAHVTPGVLQVFDLVERRNVFANRAIASLLGFAPDEVEQLSPDVVPTLMHPDDLPRFEQHLAAVSALPDGKVAAFQYRLRDRDGEWHWFDSQDAVFERDASGAARQLIVQTKEITERVLAEEKLRRLVAEVADAGRRKDEFLATLAHELRNPLAPLRHGLRVLQLTNGVGEAAVEARLIMERQIEQLVHLVDDLLDVSRISEGKLQLRTQRLELATALRNAVETSRPLVEAGGHELTVHVPSEPIFVNADLTRLGQVFANLLNNATKFSERGGQIRLAVECEGTDAVVRITDTGIGIAADMLHGVFQMFSQVDHSIEKSHGGLGIGLSLVKQLVEMHGGSVEAKSAGYGHGSEFIVRLPIDSSAMPEASSARVEPKASGAPEARRILVADDNADAAGSLATLLRFMGHEVRTAADGVAAVELATTFRPDVMLLDIGMPKLNGHDACRRIREEPWSETAVFIALTGWGQDEVRRQSLEAGFDHHLVKPVNLAALMELLASLPTVVP